MTIHLLDKERKHLTPTERKLVVFCLTNGVGAAQSRRLSVSITKTGESRYDVRTVESRTDDYGRQYKSVSACSITTKEVR